MKRPHALVGPVLIAVMLLGCSQPNATPPAAQETTQLGGGPTRVHVNNGMTGTINLYRGRPLTDDMPTFAPVGDRLWSYPGPGLPLPDFSGRADPQAVLALIATSIKQTGKPDVPQGLPAAFAGKLADGVYVYELAGVPKDPANGSLVYILKQQSDVWTATPICGPGPAWVWPGTLQQREDQTFICASSEGSDAVLRLFAYKNDRMVGYFAGLQNSYLEVVSPPTGGPPNIIVYGSDHWLYQKSDPAVRERYTLTWQNDAYALAGHERQADWVYHLARFIGFWATGESDKATFEFAVPPPGGVAAYVERNTPDLPKVAPGRWTTGGALPGRSPGNGRAYLRQAGADAGPWFFFDFDEQGRIRSIGQQKDPPKSSG